MRERAERPLYGHEAPGERAQYHARQGEEHEQRRDVANQDVLDHVHREQVVLAERVDGGDEGGEHHDHRTDESGELG
jgi:hypothetical protein